MSKRRKPAGVVDGFDTVKAAQRATAAGSGRKPARKPPEEPPRPKPEKKPAAQTAEGMRIDHTIRPTRHDVICYECGFTFFLTGALQKTYCPKCRTILEAHDHAIDNEWTGSIKTIGTVSIGSLGVVTGGVIVAETVVLAGRIEAGSVRAYGRLDLCAGSSYKEECVDAQNLVIMSGTSQVFRRKLSVRNIEICGRLKASVEAVGLIVVRAGGFFAGEARGSRLVVDEGAGLDAQLSIAAPASPAQNRESGDRKQDIETKRYSGGHAA